MKKKNKTFKNSGYSEGGASQTRTSLRGYNPLKLDVVSDVNENLKTLRSRTTDMYYNSPLGASAINTSRTHVIGAGLSPSPKIDNEILGLTSEQAKEWQRNTLKEFNLWADSVDCDLYRKNNFYDMQDIAYISYLLDGDGWAVLRYEDSLANNPYRLKVQLIEASRICCPNFFSETSINDKNGNRIISGVEIDYKGTVVAFWVANRVPMALGVAHDVAHDVAPKWVRVEAFGQRTGKPNILQISHEERPEQYRGVPYLAPALEQLKQVSRYTNAELTAAIVKSYFTLFFTQGNSGINDINSITGTEPVSPEELDHVSIGPGMMNLLPSGVEVKSIDANRNLSTFEPFTNTLISMIGASIGIPSEVLLSRFQGSYSAARAALLQAANVFKVRRHWFSRDFCQPVYEAWLTEAVALGRIKAPGFGEDPLITKAWSKADWFGPAMGMLDPVKEGQGALQRIANGLSTGEREAAELTGTDYDSNITQLALEKATWESRGLKPPESHGVQQEPKGGETDE